ncbi:MAG: thiol:disulfide interchange protein DsbA/DsbL [Gammaproteobacteria bacterium]
MLRNILILAAIAGAAAFGLSACSPADASEKAIAATEAAAKAASETATEAAGTVADAARDTAEAATQAVKMTREEAVERARSNDKLTRLDDGVQAKAAAAKEATMEKMETTAASVGEAIVAKTKLPIAAAAGVSTAIIAAGDKQFKAGKDYVVLSPAKRTSSPPGKVELTEVFMYQCPHCFSFEPFIESVLKDQPEEMNFVRLPAIFNNVAKLHAQAFYASKAMGNWEELHTPFFREIHTNRNLMPNEDKLLDFIAKQGIDRKDFRANMKSFEVDSKVRDAMDLNTAYQIGSVPTLVVNGKYVTSGQMAGSTDKLRDLVRYLVAKETAAL